jgi:GT2 family glycosyltransferase
MDVSAVVVNYQGVRLLPRCLDALERSLDLYDGATELVVVDNGSDDGSAELVRRRFPGARLLELGHNSGFAGGVNAGVAASSGSWLLLVNSDMVLAPEAVRELVAVGARDGRTGSVAAQVLFASDPDVLNSAGIVVDRLGVARDRLLGRPLAESEQQPLPVFGASGGAALYRRSMLDELGGLDESFFLYLEDIDLAWRARMRGWGAMYAPGAVAHHAHSATSGHGSGFKYFYVGRNRVWLVAKNATGRQLLRNGLGMVLYDLGYVLYAAIADRTLAPLRGRLAGLRGWRRYRRAGAPGRGPVELAPAAGVRGALQRRSTWEAHSAGT